MLQHRANYRVTTGSVKGPQQETLMTENELISQYGYVAVLVGSMIEGDGVAILGGIAARHGYLEFLLTVGSAALGGMIWDQTLFFLGRRFGESLLQRFRKHKAKIERMRGMIHRHESLWIVGVRFAYGFRLIGPLILGSSGIPVKRFIALNLLGAALWGTIMVSVGYCVGELLHRFVSGHRNLELWFGIVAVWAISITLVVRYLMRERPVKE